VTRDEWIAAFAAEAGVKGPSVEEIRELLEVAAAAAHASERTAAPLACWIAGRSQQSLPDLLEAAGRIGS
jgi:anthranilate phosphoribosyltransferase